MDGRVKKIAHITGVPGKSDIALKPWLTKRLLEEHFGSLKASVAASIINASILGVVFFASRSWQILTVAGLLMAILLVWRVSNYRNLPDAKTDPVKLKKILHSVELNAAGLGLWWGLSVVILMPGATPSQQILCAILGAGKMAAGALTYRTLKRAAYLFVGSCAAGCFISLAELGTGAAYASAILVMCYAAVLFASIRSTETAIIESHERENALRDSAETINMLLADFTEQGSDWVLEMNSQTQILNPSPQMAAALQRPIETLAGQSFLDLLDEGPERDQMADHIALGRAFRNLQVSLSIGNDRFWWSISLRPALEMNGNYRGIVTDITAQRQAEEQVSYMAHFDSLTDLPNRFQFNQRLTRVVKSPGIKPGIMYLDLDQFKIINDTLGHSFGDLLLKGVAARLKKCVSAQEIVARLGGDEFAILIENRSLTEIQKIGDDIIAALTQPFRLDDHDVIVGTSIGIALSPEHGEDAETLLRNADLALYEAKSQGRNRQIVFEDGMDQAAQLRRALELDLRGALGKGELCLHYQPLVQIDSGETLGYEALIRWEHPERGVVMPDTFIPIAEESGMIIPIGEWVIRQAIDDLTQWPDNMTVSINLSPVQMRSPSLITTLVQGLAATGVEPKRVCLEITENVLMQDSDANMATLHKLHEIGVQIALDDFGTGYSSLNYLRSFPFDKIKIDRCFVDEIDTREDCQAIVRSVVDLARSLGMTTTAEGVERDDQVEHLRREGCSEVQGYLFSKAVPQDQLTDLRKPVHSHAQRLVDMETKRKLKQEIAARVGRIQKGKKTG
ncbi:putative bifunctional diguanylate cyclase/phosphodiesterase [Sphingorhabdus arenilitoris]|uniref:Bifunctional diguanylate cyclase/phosphodiesterase n=1 Tax=Sphingorhabdus arenilitoris TaxID=1490041 RepID=A0ABV8RBX1_9SPHN